MSRATFLISEIVSKLHYWALKYAFNNYYFDVIFCFVFCFILSHDMTCIYKNKRVDTKTCTDQQIKHYPNHLPNTTNIL